MALSVADQLSKLDWPKRDDASAEDIRHWLRDRQQVPGVDTDAITRLMSVFETVGQEWSSTPAKLREMAVETQGRSGAAADFGGIRSHQGTIAASQASQELLAVLLRLPPYEHEPAIPSFEFYDAAPKRLGPDDYRELLENDALREEAPDCRTTGYLSAYIGADLQKSIIVGQQVLKAAFALTHTEDDEALRTYLISSMGMVQEQAKLLSKHFDVFRTVFPPSTDFRNLDDAQRGAIEALVTRSHNWGFRNVFKEGVLRLDQAMQPEHFANTGPTIDRLLRDRGAARSLDETATGELSRHDRLAAEGTSRFRSFLHEQLQAPDTLRKHAPAAGAILFNLGLTEGIDREVHEALQTWQAINRFMGLGLKSARQLVPLDDIAASPQPFPKDKAQWIAEHAKRAQTSVKLLLILANAREEQLLTPGEARAANWLGQYIARSALPEIIAVFDRAAAETKNEGGISPSSGPPRTDPEIRRVHEQLTAQLKAQHQAIDKHLAQAADASWPFDVLPASRTEAEAQLTRLFRRAVPSEKARLYVIREISPYAPGVDPELLK